MSKKPIVIILLALFFTITTCTTDNSITGNSDQTLGKTTGVVDINSPKSGGDDDDCISTDIGDWILSWYGQYGAAGLMVILINRLLDIYKDTHVLDGLEGGYFRGPGNNSQNYNNYVTQPSYDFRDNYMSKSVKGREYTEFYYALSKYGIKNNLVNKYPQEHLELLIISTAIAHNLQHGNNNEEVLIHDVTSDALNNMLKVYRDSPNHIEIKPVLDYLETDLKKYQNKPKHEIAADFEEN